MHKNPNKPKRIKSVTYTWLYLFILYDIVVPLMTQYTSFAAASNVISKDQDSWCQGVIAGLFRRIFCKKKQYRHMSTLWTPIDLFNCLNDTMYHVRNYLFMVYALLYCIKMLRHDDDGTIFRFRIPFNMYITCWWVRMLFCKTVT